MKNIVDFLFKGALNFPDKTAFVFLQDKTKALELTYAALAEKVRRLGNGLVKKKLSGKKIFLLYPDGIDFIISFLACQHAGAIAIPMYPPRGNAHADRLKKIILDIHPDVVLTTEFYFSKIKKIIAETGKASNVPVHCQITDDDIKKEDVISENTSSQPVSFIQYTSGSTGNPKGVIITHRNLLHNQELIEKTFHCNQNSVIGCWLPFYHDMGLIGNILHTIYVGATCVLISPFSFFQRPQVWLELVGKYKVTHTGGPNFAYDLCADTVPEKALKTLDLSSWKVAYNGSEPVRPETIERFSDYFKPAGFKQDTFYPCYGLAEATLLVSGGKTKKNQKVIYIDSERLKKGILIQLPRHIPGAKRIMSSGHIVDGMKVKILNNEKQMVNTDFQLGEICIRGESVFKGYWNDNKRLDAGKNIPDGYFHTGDLGFIFENHLFVTGRLKEMIIVRGKNYYPQDIETCASQSHTALKKNGTAAFSAEINGYCQLVVIAEIKKEYAGNNKIRIEILNAMESRLAQEAGISPYDIVLVGPMSIPRTSSGKIKRLQCAELYTNEELGSVSGFKKVKDPSEKSNIHTLIRACTADMSRENISRYLEQVFASKLPFLNINLTNEELELTAIGIDSLRTMEIINAINKDLQINLDATRIYQVNTVSELLTVIENTLWLNNKVTGHKITI